MNHPNLTLEKVLIVGTGGIGSALTEHLINETQTQVFTLSRVTKQNAILLSKNHQHISIDEYTSQSLAQIAEEIGTIDLLICCIGWLHNQVYQPEKRLENLNTNALMHYFKINTVLPSLIIQQFWQCLKQPQPTTLACISAKVGSIGDNRIGGWYGYRASKAALNMMIKNFSIELQRRAPKLRLFALHPGTTDTDLSKPFQQRLPQGQLKSLPECAQQLISTLMTTQAASGSFLNWDGAILPW